MPKSNRHKPHARMPKPLSDLRTKYGFRYMHGTHNVVDSMHVHPNNRVMVIGDRSHGDFVHALVHSASRKTPHVFSHIVPRGRTVSKSSRDLQDILALIREHRPDVIMFAFKMKNWPAREEIYAASQRANPTRLFAAMPEITTDVVSQILPAETTVMEAETVSLSKFLEKSRGREMLIRTMDKIRKYSLKALIPKSKTRLIHCDIPSPGTVFNIPSGEAFFSPKKMDGEIYLTSGSIIGDMGIVKEGVKAEFSGNELHGVEWSSLHDKHIVNRLMQRLDAMGTFECSELGIGTHPNITLKNAGTNPLLITKVINTLNLGFGKPRATPLGNVRDDNSFNVVVPRSIVSIGSRQIIERLS